jgi:hypothetical protein
LHKARFKGSENCADARLAQFYYAGAKALLPR